MLRRNAWGPIAAMLAAHLAPLSPAEAHDFWIIPSQFQLKIDQKDEVYFNIYVGEKLSGDSMKRYREHLKTFQARSAAKPEAFADIGGRFGQMPIGWVQLDPTADHVVNYTSFPSSVELDEAKFKHYLESEGLSHLVTANLPKDRPVKERFSRYAKTLITAADRRRPADAVTGMDFELVLLKAKDTPQTFVWEVRLHGQPLAGCQVQLVSDLEKKILANERTRDDGHARFVIDKPGVYMAKAVHLLKGREGFDWESLWASATFAVQATQ